MKFSELDLYPALAAGVQSQNFSECTPIQELSIPTILEGKDVAGLAQTGTGKTAAFILPLMERILRTREVQGTEFSEPAADTDKELVVIAPEKRKFSDWQKSSFILVLVPTRELAEQVYETVKLFGQSAGIGGTAIYGGMAYDKQKKAISHGVEFVVATPGRLIDLYKEHVLDLRQVRAVVFDEADRMFDMGFKDDMKYILHRIPRDRQMLVFSATLNFDVLNVCYEFGSEPVEINVSKDQPKAENVDDSIFHVGVNDKPGYLLSILKKELPRQAIVFSNFKRNVERITQFLNKNGIPAVGISSLMTQAQRNRVMTQFKSDNERNILVATDLAARGLDVVGVDIVINFELPDDPENYVHRIGRTGRAGTKGRAFSLVADRDLDALQRIEGYLEHKVEMGWLDDQFLISDFAPFPKEWELASYPARPKNPEKNGTGGGSRDRRGPRSDEDSVNRQGGGQRPRRPRRSRGASAPYRPLKQNETSTTGESETHRDRSLGRHRGNNGNRKGSENAGSQSPHPHSRQGGPRQEDGGGRSQRRSGHGRREGSKANRSSRPDDRQRKNSSSREGWQGKSNKARGATAPSQRASQRQVVAKGSLGKKVSSFFKKLFGNS